MITGVDWAKGPDMAVWVQDVWGSAERMDDTTFRSECRHWWARPWGALSRGDRRRLKRRQRLLARWRAWDDEADARLDDLHRLVYGEIDTSSRIGMRVTTADLLPAGAAEFWRRQSPGDVDTDKITEALDGLWGTVTK
jgi:hypothetical protein